MKTHKDPQHQFTLDNYTVCGVLFAPLGIAVVLMVPSLSGPTSLTYMTFAILASVGLTTTAIGSWRSAKKSKRVLAVVGPILFLSFMAVLLLIMEAGRQDQQMRHWAARALVPLKSMCISMCLHVVTAGVFPISIGVLIAQN